MKTLAPFAASLLISLLPAMTSAEPFDMSRERPATSAEQPVAKPVPETRPLPRVDAVRHRYIIPFQSVRLDGEVASKTWTILLTPVQAASALTLNYGYHNSVLVAPETSRLSIYINDTLINSEPVQSPGGILERSLKIPEDLLRPGANKVSFRAVQQHRTDCTVQSTYELWSEIIPEKTFLVLDSKTPQPVPSIDDVRAIGVDKQGRTHFNIFAPGLQQSTQTDALMRLSQGLALLGRMPNQSFNVVPSLGPVAGSGEMTVAMGTATDLAGVFPDLPQNAKNGSFVGFVQSRRNEWILVLSGPTWKAVDEAVTSMVLPLQQPPGTVRDALSTQAWTGSDTPILRSSTTMPFSRLGIATTEFSGRRFRTGFDIGVTADFYANAYGEAKILLDAAYSAAVLPGSHIDIYVNGNIASTVPVTSKNGGILRHLPIRLTMRHFRPGLNRIELEAVLQTKADTMCVPGAPASAEPRFALFDTSTFEMPDFARIAQLPNLEAAAGTGFPYMRGTDDVALFMDRMDSPTMSAAATFIGKLAVAAGRPVTTVTKTATALIGDSNAIFVGAISQIPPVALAQVNIVEESRTVWGNQAAVVDLTPNNNAALDDWGRRVRGGSWAGQFSEFADWLKDTFDISLDSLQFLPADEPDTLPDNAATFLVAQGLSPDKTGSWAVVAAPTAKDLQQGMLDVSDEARWQQMAGHLSLFKKGTDEMQTLPSSQTVLVQTQPFSLWNYRLIAANWLSSNILSYALLFAGLSTLVGLATSVLLNRFGRRS